MKKTYLLILLGYGLNSLSQNAGVFPRKSPQAEGICEFNTKVKFAKPASGNCYLDPYKYCAYYPVIIEDFNFRRELPNNWKFNGGSYDDAYKGLPTGCVSDSLSGFSWLGKSEDAFRRSTTVSNSELKLIWEKTPTTGNPQPWNPSSCPNLQYNFTGAFFQSLGKFREGVFTARLKIPNNPQFWPAYWLRSDAPESNRTQEIDIFEYFPNSSSNCDLYGELSTSIHGYPAGSPFCSRVDKFPFSGLNIGDPWNSYYYYTCFWTKDRIQVYVNSTLVVEATRFYDGTKPKQTCHWGQNRNVPNDIFYCQDLLTNPFPNKNIKKDAFFPDPISPMSLIFSNSINRDNKNITLNNPISFDIDYVAVYQPQDCNNIYNLCSLTDFNNATGGTDFLTGLGIEINNSSSPCLFKNDGCTKFTEPCYILYDTTLYGGRPLHMLAHDYVAIYGDAEFPEGTFLRAETIPYYGYSPINRTTNNINENTSNDESLNQHLNFINELMQKNDEYEANHFNQENSNYDSPFISEVDNLALTLFPNPASNKVYFKFDDEEDFSDILKIELIDNLGRSFEVTDYKNGIDVRNLVNGFYNLRFIFTNGFVLVKSFVKN